MAFTDQLITTQPQKFSNEIIACESTMQLCNYECFPAIYSTTVKLFHLEQFAIYSIFTKYVCDFVHMYSTR